MVMDVSQYLDIFIDETREHIQNLNTQILNLEQNPDNMDTVNEIFRAAHSLKGMAGTMGYKRMQNLTHDMENVFSEVRNNNIKVSAEIIDVIFQCIDALEDYLLHIQETADEGTDDNAPLIKALNDILEGKNQVVEESSVIPENVQKLESEQKIEKWREIKLSESDCSLIAEAKQRNMFTYGITIYIQETCILKAARAFLVFKTLEELGEVLISNPSAQAIEDEQFSLDFSIIIISEHPIENLISAIKNVSEIEEAIGGPLQIEYISDETDEKAEGEMTEDNEYAEIDEPVIAEKEISIEQKVTNHENTAVTATPKNRRQA